MKEQDYICALKSIMGQAEMMVADIESKTPNVVERHDKETFTDEPVIKVEAWYWSENEIPKRPPRKGALSPRALSPNMFYDWYKFTGQPDWNSIIRETIDNGAEVVRVTPVKGVRTSIDDPDAIPCAVHPFLLAVYPIESNGNTMWSSDRFPDIYCLGVNIDDPSFSDATIEVAIREHHKANEPKPKFEVGQWLYSTTNILKHRLCKVTGYNDGYVKVETQDGQRFAWSESCLRPAVPADFDVKVGNMKVRACEVNSNECVCLRWSDGSLSWVTKPVAAALGYPVCPLTVSGGKFEAPK